MEQNRQKTTQGEVWLDKDGILHQEYAKGAELKLQDSRAELKLYQTRFCHEGKRPIVVDLTGIKTVSKESREIYSSEEMGNILSAAALIVGNPVSRIMGNFYMGINRTRMPVRMFTRTTDARKWLKEFLP